MGEAPNAGGTTLLDSVVDGLGIISAIRWRPDPEMREGAHRGGGRREEEAEHETLNKYLLLLRGCEKKTEKRRGEETGGRCERWRGEDGGCLRVRVARSRA